VTTLLGIYLELVLPKQYGSSKHPCFLCRKKVEVDSAKLLESYKKKRSGDEENEYIEKITDHSLLE
jgi:hypothetical protein